MSDPVKRMQLPRLVDPRKLSVQGARLEGDVPTDGMERLRSAVMSADPTAKLSLLFRRDEMNRCIVEGDFSLGVRLQCQRCLGEMSEQLQGELLFGVVWDEERAAVLPKWLDPWLITGEEADLYNLVEDEVILALPIVAFHDEDTCPVAGHYSTGEVAEHKDNPFSVLEKLKK